MGSFRVLNFVCVLIVSHLLSAAAHAVDVAATLTALRLAGTITGGSMPTSDPLFNQMVTQIQAGDLQGAALTAANSKYFANYLAKRLAFQMQSPALDATVTNDNDSTAFLIAHFTGGAGVPPSISTLWSDNSTYLVTAPNGGLPLGSITIMENGKPVVGAAIPGIFTNDFSASNVATAVHVNQYPKLSNFSTNVAEIDWSTALVRSPQPQQAVSAASVNAQAPAVYVPIPANHVGGFTTASTAPYGLAGTTDNSFSQYGTLLGTNLRMIEAIWEVATGVTLVEAEDTNYTTGDPALAHFVPQFVPEVNPNFFVGQGQSACISCHGGGLSSLKHGYSTVGDVFDYNQNYGFVYSDPTTIATGDRKSLGSTAANRNATLKCPTVNPTVACNPYSAGVDPDQGWDLSSWQASGLLATMGWRGPTTGQGLNQLGQALGQADIVYQFLTERIIAEICPVGMFTAQDVATIAAAADPYAPGGPGTDDIRTIVTMVAINPTCL